MSRLFKRKDTPHYYYTVGTPPNRIVRSTGTKELTIAKRIKRKWDEEYILQKHHINVSQILLYDLIDKYYNVISPIKTHTWAERMSCAIKALKSLIPNIFAHDLKKYDVNQYVAQRFKNAKTATIQKEIRLLKNILDFGVDNQYNDRNVAINIALPKSEPNQYPPFTNEVLKTIFNRCIKRDLIYWKILLYTGLRAGDGGTIAKIEIKDNMIIRFQQKTKKQVIIPLHKELLIYGNNIIMIMPERSDRNSSFRRLKKILHQIGVDGNLHTFRHTFATRLFELGLSSEDIKIVTGHSTATMTSNYTHPRFDYIAKIFKKL